MDYSDKNIIVEKECEESQAISDEECNEKKLYKFEKERQNEGCGAHQCNNFDEERQDKVRKHGKFDTKRQDQSEILNNSAGLKLMRKQKIVCRLYENNDQVCDEVQIVNKGKLRIVEQKQFEQKLSDL